ncbi:hypothetical protein BFR34_06090 [Brochothrix thermosphacta DSM 20171 = FSL F6-1036]|uniref:Ig-like domain-containing protein n=1 Tax=Brochothrix thermosphacta TaxID=2756 RepID=UPI00048B5346|nr:Ig-like domain-containing protein [Brochothrix thermosphacta]ODJ49206.1 hypothetical protein BFR34_06090 [Brochothrix thermosphacta DSM 20171 = FSL F6-1036]
MDKTELTLEVGQSDTLTATVVPENAEDKTVTFTSGNDKVATVTPKQGKVTAVAKGATEIEGVTANGIVVKLPVTVTEPAGG